MGTELDGQSTLDRIHPPKDGMLTRHCQDGMVYSLHFFWALGESQTKNPSICDWHPGARGG